MSDAMTHPGEFEVLRTKAEAGLWDSGYLTITNYRIRWTPSRIAKGWTPSGAVALPRNDGST